MKTLLTTILLLLSFTAQCEQTITFRYQDAVKGKVIVHTNTQIPVKCKHLIRNIGAITVDPATVHREAIRRLQFCNIWDVPVEAHRDGPLIVK